MVGRSTVSVIRPPSTYTTWLLSFYRTVFFPPCVTPQFQVFQDRCGNCPLGSGPTPGDWWYLVRLGCQHWQRGLEACSLPRFSHSVQNGGMEYSGGACISVLGPSQNNTGEAAIEPERTQEHSLSNFAGGQHFFEYLLVVSLKKKRSGDDYEPTITYQFPKVRTEERWGLKTEVGKQKCV